MKKKIKPQPSFQIASKIESAAKKYADIRNNHDGRQSLKDHKLAEYDFYAGAVWALNSLKEPENE